MDAPSVPRGRNQRHGGLGARYAFLTAGDESLFTLYSGLSASVSGNISGSWRIGTFLFVRAEAGLIYFTAPDDWDLNLLVMLEIPL